MGFFECCEIVEQYQDVFENIQPCQEHKLPILFVCLEDSCQKHSLLCSECITKHRAHNWVNISHYFTDQVKTMFRQGKSSLGNTVYLASLGIMDRLWNFRDKLIRKTEMIAREMADTLKTLEKRYPIKGQFNITGKAINNQNAIQIKKILQRQQNKKWVKPMQKMVIDVVQQTQKNIMGLLHDMQDLFDHQNWQQKGEQYENHLYQRFKNHLHQHPIRDPEYFKFSQVTKHSGISLSADRLQATFIKNNPSKPAVVLNEPFSYAHHKIMFFVTCLQKKAFLFPSSLIAVGACIPSTVKVNGYRKITQSSKGTFMIGSSGYCYHHSNPQYDRQDIMGWSFGQGDIITVEIIHEKAGGRIHFTKNKGNYFEKNFEMQLGLPKEEVYKLKPCVMFDGDEGAKIRIYNQKQ